MLPQLGELPRHKQLTSGLLSLAALLFPFSVAGCNICLALALLVSVSSGQWWQGAKLMFSHARLLSLAVIAYLLLFPLGLLWSSDPGWGLEIFSHQWFWLLLPVMVSSLFDAVSRRLFTVALSAGLAAHLIFVVFQALGWSVITDFAGSNADDATGYIGHIGFGVVYGVWAGWLWFAAAEGTQVWKHIGRLLAILALVMILLAKGRSGYLVALVTVLAAIGMESARYFGLWRATTFMALAGLLLSILLVVGPTGERVMTMVHDVQNIRQGEAANVDVRWAMWQGAIEVWRAHPWLGVGTGGFHNAMLEVQANHPDGSFGDPLEGVTPVHPHNQYLLNLTRWGPIGILVLLVMFYNWALSGIRLLRDGDNSGYWLLFSVLAVAVHGLTSPSLEDHFTAIFAMFAMGSGLSVLLSNNKVMGMNSDPD